MNRTPWFLRTFLNIADNGLLPGILERLEGTPARIKEKISRMDSSVLNRQSPEKWSIKKEIGHLIDLEPLWQQRIDQIASGADQMMVADLTNRKTHIAPYDDKDIEELIAEFKQVRRKTMVMLNSLTDEDLDKSSLHPRLMKPMRIIDLAFFVAEHDDHHLAQITFLGKSHDNT
jgi:uncharacterized damage-inducible protein DinB